MKKIIPIAIILIALVTLAWYYAGGKPSADTAMVSETETMQQEDTTPAEAVFTNENPTKAAVEAGIVGTWRATDDEKSVVEFGADGTTRDVYDGNELSTGSWTVVTTDIGELTGATVLETTINENVYRYMVWQVNENQLVLNYTDRGNTLVYTRVVE